MGDAQKGCKLRKGCPRKKKRQSAKLGFLKKQTQQKNHAQKSAPFLFKKKAKKMRIFLNK